MPYSDHPAHLLLSPTVSQMFDEFYLKIAVVCHETFSAKSRLPYYQGVSLHNYYHILIFTFLWEIIHDFGHIFYTII